MACYRLPGVFDSCLGQVDCLNPLRYPLGYSACHRMGQARQARTVRRLPGLWPVGSASAALMGTHGHWQTLPPNDAKLVALHPVVAVDSNPIFCCAVIC